MAEISKRRLKEAETHLRSIAEKPSELKNQDVDWKVVKQQLLRLQSALQQDDRNTFDEAYIMVKRRLNQPNVLRGEIGPEPAGGSAVVPPPVLELINHIVDKLHFDLTESNDKELRE